MVKTLVTIDHNDLAQRIAAQEGGKVNLPIAQVKEVLFQAMAELGEISVMLGWDGSVAVVDACRAALDRRRASCMAVLVKRGVKQLEQTRRRRGRVNRGPVGKRKAGKA